MHLRYEENIEIFNRSLSAIIVHTFILPLNVKKRRTKRRMPLELARVSCENVQGSLMELVWIW